MSASKSFVERVLEVITGGDKAKVERLQKKAIRKLDNTIKSNIDKIDNLKDKLTDLKDKQNETVHHVDMNRISTSESTDSYVDSYLSSINAAIEEELRVVSQIEDLAKQNERAEAIKKLLN